MWRISLLLFALACFAQTIDIVSPKAQLRRGEKITLTYSLTGTANIAAFQWTDFPDSRFALGNRVLTVAPALQKTLHCEGNICLVVGLNRNVIPNGGVLTVDLTVLPGAGMGQGIMQLQGVLAAAPDGTASPLLAGPAVTFTILANEDLNGDGRIDLVDLLILVDQALGRSPCGSADLDKDGACTIRDAQLLVAAAVAP